MRLAIFVLAGLIMTGDVRAEENQVTVRGLSPHLQLTGWRTSWQVQGEIVPPVYPLPGGRILAIVNKGQADARHIVLWSKEGQELGRGAFDIQSEIKAGQVFGGRLVVASSEEIAEFDTTTLQKGRFRSLVAPASKTTLYAPTPSGLWVIGDAAVSHFDLDGRPPVKIARPLIYIDKPRCADIRGELKQPCSFGLQLDRTRAVASETGEVIVIDVFRELYPYTGRSVDEVWPSTGTVLDTKGTVVAQKPLSWMKTRWEWFWFKEGNSGDPVGWPQLGGLVRTRYETARAPASLPFASRGGDFLFWKISDERDDTVLFRTDRRLKTVWKRKLADFGGEIVSPSWTSQVLLHDNGCRKFSSVAEHGTIIAESKVEIREILLELQRTKFKRPRFAIGQSKEGDWLLIAY